MTKKHAITIGTIIAIITVGITAIIFTPVSKSQISEYEKKEAEYNELKKNHEEFVEMCEGYKDDQDNLSKKYEQIKKDFKEYEEKYNDNTDLDKELEELTKKKEKYLNMIEDYSSQLDNL